MLFGYTVRQHIREGHRFPDTGLKAPRAYGAVKSKAFQNHHAFSMSSTELIQ